jgi:hypothetical protein
MVWAVGLVLLACFIIFHLRRKFFNECMDSLSALWWFAGLAGLYSPQTDGMHMVGGLVWWPGRHELVYFHVVIWGGAELQAIVVRPVLRTIKMGENISLVPLDEAKCDGCEGVAGSHPSASSITSWTPASYVDRIEHVIAERPHVCRATT